jgi:hypothetical protein
MKIETLEQLEEAKKIILEMKSQATNEFVISVFDEMLLELNKGDVENLATPEYLSIIRFGYNIFELLSRI